MKTILIAAMSVSLAPLLGEPVTIHGVGGDSCAEMRAEVQAGYDTMYRHWIGGYLTSTNTTAKSGDVAKGKSVGEIFLQVQDFCQHSPDYTVEQVMNLLTTEALLEMPREI